MLDMSFKRLKKFCASSMQNSGVLISFVSFCVLTVSETIYLQFLTF